MSDKTLYEIYSDVYNNKPVKEEDLRLALLAYRSLLWFANHDVEEIYKLTDENVFAKARFESNVMRYKNALNTTPKHWLGNENIPGTEEFKEKDNLLNNILKNYEQWKKDKEDL